MTKKTIPNSYNFQQAVDDSEDENYDYDTAASGEEDEGYEEEHEENHSDNDDDVDAFFAVSRCTYIFLQESILDLRQMLK